MLYSHLLRTIHGIIKSKEQERDFMKKMEGILAVATIHGNNSPTVTLLGEVLKLQKESAERKERCVEMLLEIDGKIIVL